MEKISEEKLINLIRNAKSDEETLKILKDNVDTNQVVSLIQSTLGKNEIRNYNEEEDIEYSYDAEERKKIRDELTSNSDYITWLDAFLYDRESFDDESIKYSNNLSKEDLTNISKLGIFFEAIDNYARMHSISDGAYSKTEDGYSFKINLCDFAFEIEVSIGPNVIFFVKKLPYNEDTKYINFKDVIIKTKEKFVKENKSKIKKLTLDDSNTKKGD